LSITPAAVFGCVECLFCEKHNPWMLSNCQNKYVKC